ncbi:hypothetical protein J1N35_038472 [Gossypium stocksii]|uniref:Reverse transcriptase domain-containing protein n=1 Tax=Gossypium stocksii TaxID=47602 RepID=A0A9D3ZMN7_9ROSI|nr:hypothetical protein J1N35_038472 [Gossypium stocksii]
MGINGKNREQFRPQRGLRQGDPLSSYLFLICAEGFLRPIELAKREGRLSGTNVGRGNVSISHLFFADDSILFGEASIDGENNLKRVIKDYEEASGQLVNFDRSLIYFSGNVDLATQDQVGPILGVRVSNNPEKYLGLPTMVGHRKKHAFVAIKERCVKLLSNWNMILLSTRGKERSVWGVRHLLEEEMGWQIGNGEFVNIWNDNWLPGPGNGSIMCQNIDIRYSKVADLINKETNTWKHEVINTLFGKEPVKAIVSIPLNPKIHKLIVNSLYPGARNISFGGEIAGTCKVSWPIWEPPNNDTIKINFDAFFNQISRRSVSGIIARNKEGLIMAACTYPWENIPDPMMADASAYLQAIIMVEYMGFQDICIEGDALTIMNKLNSKEEDKSCICNLIKEIKRRGNNFRKLSFRHVPREANMVAHVMAKERGRYEQSRFWIKEAPNMVEIMADRERRNRSPGG